MKAANKQLDFCSSFCINVIIYILFDSVSCEINGRNGGGVCNSIQFNFNLNSHKH